jgi:YD repeat-containing protein
LYYLASQITGTTDGVNVAKSETFAYDALGRLTDATGGYGDIDYAYDVAHNRTSRTWTQGGSTVIEALTLASASNQVTQVSDGTDTRTFGYDAAGNVTADTRYDGTAFAYVYDQRGRLAELKRNAVTEATYLVDARHLRVAKLTSLPGIGSRHYLYDQDGHLLAEADAATGQVLRDYVWLGDQPLAAVTDVDTASPRTHYIHTDHLGTPELITQADKTVAWNPTLTPFGELASVAGTLGFDLRLPGQYADAESDLHQNWHRD